MTRRLRLEQHLHRVAQLSQAEVDALAAAKTARLELDTALRTARTAGATWAELGTAAGLPLETARSRVEDPQDLARHRRAIEIAALPGISVTAACELLGTSRTQLRRWVVAGMLHELQVEGRKRPRIATDAAWETLRAERTTRR